MEIILYRHAEPVVSNEEIISGRDFEQWVQSGWLKDKHGLSWQVVPPEFPVAWKENSGLSCIQIIKNV